MATRRGEQNPKIFPEQIYSFEENCIKHETYEEKDEIGVQTSVPISDSC